MFRIHRPTLVSTVAAIALSGAAAAIAGLTQASADTLPAFTCTDKSGGTGGVTGTVTSIRVAHHDGYDRLVIGFATSLTVPQYELQRQATSTFIRDPSGRQTTLDGSAGIRAVFRGSDTTNGLPSDLTPRLSEIREVANIGNFERVVSYGIGLEDQACFRVFELSGPSRLVIDVQTPPDVSAANPAGTTQPSSAAAASAAAAQPSNLAATGHPGAQGGPAGTPLAAILLGVLAVTAGLTVTALRRFGRR